MRLNEKSKKTSPQSTKRAQDWWSKFVGGDLSDEAKETCKNWTMWDSAFPDLLQHLCDSQLKFSVKKEVNRVGYIAFIQPALQGHKFDGWILSGRGSTPFKALKQACYRHFVQYDEDWPIDWDQEAEEAFND